MSLEGLLKNAVHQADTLLHPHLNGNQVAGVHRGETQATVDVADELSLQSNDPVILRGPDAVASKAEISRTRLAPPTYPPTELKPPIYNGRTVRLSPESPHAKYHIKN